MPSSGAAMKLITAPQIFPQNLSKTHNFSLTSFIIFFTFLFLFQIPQTSSLRPTHTPPEYSKYCDVVPVSPVEHISLLPSSNVNHLDFIIGYFTGGASIFFFSNISAHAPKGATFYVWNFQKTGNNTSQIYKIEGKLGLRIPISFLVSSYMDGDLNPRRGLQRKFRISGPRLQIIGRRMPSFELSGYWSESTGKLCMVGSGVSNGDAGKFRIFNVVLKLHYSNNLNVSGSLVSGVLKSLDSEHSVNYFEPVSLLGLRKSFENYEFSLVDNGKASSCLSRVQSEGESLAVSEAKGGFCSAMFEHTITCLLDYGKDCDKVGCSSIIKDVKYVPRFMFFRQIKCVDKGKMQILFGFQNSSTRDPYFPFDPNSSLIGEAAWDDEKNSVCGIACRVLNVRDSLTKASVGDCSIKFSLRYPKVFSLRNRNSVVGKFWSDKDAGDPSYFGMIRFRSVKEESPGFKSVPGLKYEYTEIGRATRSCAIKKSAKHNGKRYPDGGSLDMRFDMLVTDSKGESAWGFANLLFVDNQVYQRQPYGVFQPAVRLNNGSRLLNISYEIIYTYKSFNHYALPKVVEISAEGIYDRDTGALCMVGCKPVRYSHNQNSIKDEPLDCDIVINVQFSPINAAKEDRVKGTIKSTRAKSDPLYFGPINLSSRSIYSRQAKDSIWRMDLEITMVLVSNTLACVFVLLQLFHVKKHPEVVPFISIVMLILLMLGYMIPLLLNFEALFINNHNQQTAFLESGGWLEVNEIIVRAVTMVAFLLQFRLLQLTWSARQSDESQKGLWNSEKKVLLVSLPVYVTGGLIAWLVHKRNNFRRRPFIQLRERHLRNIIYRPYIYQQHSFWSDLKSYGGLVLDGFLLPQVVFNILSKSNERALASSFYVGTTLVRLLPHAYDLYRAHSSYGKLGLSYIYANHKMDFFSTAWDIIIPFGGFLLALLIFLQQQFGARCFLPKRFREDAAYQKVSVDSNNVELQGESVQKNFNSL